MKIRTLFIGITLLSPFVMANTSAPELLPEVVRLIDIKPINDQHMAQNAYVYLMALNAEDDNYFAIGKKMVEQENNDVRLAIKEHNETPLKANKNNPAFRYKQLNFDRMLDNKTYKYPCWDLNNLHCIQTVINDLPQLAVLFEKNKVLLARYQAVLDKPYYYDYSPMTNYSVFPSFSTVLASSSFQQIAAVNAIEQGDVDKGIAIFQQEQSFAKRILASRTGFIDKMIAIRLLQTQYHTIAGLLDHPNLQNSLTSDALVALLKPLSTREQQAIASAAESELAMQLVQLETLDNLEEVKADLSNLVRSKEQYSIDFNYNRAQTMNEAFKKMLPFINLAKVTLPDAQKTYQTLRNYHPETVCQETDNTASCLPKMKQRYGDNLIGGYLLEIAIPNNTGFLFRLYDLSNYLALVNAKLLIKQQSINAEDIPAFLEHLGDKAKNPYNLKPFRWNEKKSTLSTQSLDNKEHLEFSLYIVPNRS